MVKDPTTKKEIFNLKINYQIIDLIQQLSEFFNNANFRNLPKAFTDDQTRFEVKIFIYKYMCLLAEKLVLEKLEPISIKIDCDKNKYPDIITSLKDSRNWI